MTSTETPKEKITMTCACGGNYSSERGREIHEISQKHKRFLNIGVVKKRVIRSKLSEEEKIQRRREYQREYYKSNPDVWRLTPSYNRGKGYFYEMPPFTPKAEEVTQ
jgi:hypothetical protein